MHKLKLDILCLQETWLERHSILLLEERARIHGLALYTTQPKRDGATGEGTAILVRKGVIKNSAPILKQLWEHSAAALIVHAKEKGCRPVKLAILSFYSPHHLTSSADARLRLLTTSIKEFHPQI